VAVCQPGVGARGRGLGRVQGGDVRGHATRGAVTGLALGFAQHPHELRVTTKSHDWGDGAGPGPRVEVSGEVHPGPGERGGGVRHYHCWLG